MSSWLPPYVWCGIMLWSTSLVNCHAEIFVLTWLQCCFRDQWRHLTALFLSSVQRSPLSWTTWHFSRLLKFAEFTPFQYFILFWSASQCKASLQIVFCIHYAVLWYRKVMQTLVSQRVCTNDLNQKTDISLISLKTHLVQLRKKTKAKTSFSAEAAGGESKGYKLVPNPLSPQANQRSTPIPFSEEKKTWEYRCLPHFGRK